MFKLLACALIVFVVLRVGLTVLRALSTPPPAPPPPGELRKVNLRFRCSVCGTELKMTVAAVEEPEPPPPGELRKVNLRYRCRTCGTEVRMTAAPDELPEPPRHCMEEMELVAPPFE